jgi:hypothetical protein
MFGCRHEKLRAHDLELKYREQASRELALKSKADKQTAVLKEAAIETDVRNNDVWSLTLALRLAWDCVALAAAFVAGVSSSARFIGDGCTVDSGACLLLQRGSFSICWESCSLLQEKPVSTAKVQGQRPKKATREEISRLSEEAARVAAAAKEAARIAAAAEDSARAAAAAETAARIAAEKTATGRAVRNAVEKVGTKEAARIAAEKVAAEEAARIVAEKAARIAAEKAPADEAARIAAEYAGAEEAARIAAE